MKVRDFNRIKKIAEERGGGEKDKRRIKKVEDTEKRLYDNRQKRICDNLPDGRTIVVKDNEVLKLSGAEKKGGSA